MAGAPQWPQADVEALKDLLGKRLSAAEIAIALSDALGHLITRSMVLGKLNRLGLRLDSGLKGAPPRRERPDRRARAALVRSRSGETSMASDQDDPPGLKRRCSLLELTPHSCRWPIGFPGTPDFCFCGKLSETGAPYCREHLAQAWVGPTPRGALAKRV